MGRQNSGPDYYQRRQQQREDHQWKENLKLTQQADNIRLGIDAKVRAERDAGQKRIDVMVKQLDADHVQELKYQMGRPIQQYSGGVHGNVTVNHWKTPLPNSKAESGPLVSMGVGGLKSMLTELRSSTSGLLATPEGRVYETAFNAAVGEVRKRYRNLPKLVDNNFSIDLFRAAELTRDDKREEVTELPLGRFTTPYTVTHVPTLLSAAITPEGLELVYAQRDGDSVEKWNSKLPLLRSALRARGFDASNMVMKEDKDGNIQMSFNDTDPFSDLDIHSGEFDAGDGRSLLGLTSTGKPAWITWKGSSGMVVGGVPGSGKTASMLPLFAGMRDHAELHVFDGKAGYDLHPLRHIARTYDRSGTIESPLELLREMRELRARRANALHNTLHANNFWNVPIADRERIGMYPVFIVLDEVQQWLDQSGMDKDEKAASTEITKAVRELIQQGRSAGMIVVLTTQKPDATSIPTKIRDNAALKLCFRVSTPEQAICVIGSQSKDAPDPTKIPMSRKGRAVMETEGYGIVLLQSGYTSPEDLEQVLANAHPVPNQTEVAQRLSGGTTTAPRFETATETVAPTETAAPEPTSTAETDSQSSAQMDFSQMSDEELMQHIDRVSRKEGTDDEPEVETSEDRSEASPVDDTRSESSEDRSEDTTSDETPSVVVTDTSNDASSSSSEPDWMSDPVKKQAFQMGLLDENGNPK